MKSITKTLLITITLINVMVSSCDSTSNEGETHADLMNLKNLDGQWIFIEESSSSDKQIWTLFVELDQGSEKEGKYAVYLQDDPWGKEDDELIQKQFRCGRFKISQGKFEGDNVYRGTDTNTGFNVFNVHVIRNDWRHLRLPYAHNAMFGQLMSKMVDRTRLKNGSSPYIVGLTLPGYRYQK
jgi:hypothetical protein